MNPLISRLLLASCSILLCVSCKDSIKKDNVKIISESIDESGNWRISFKINPYDKNVVYAGTEWVASNKVHIDLSESQTNKTSKLLTMKDDQFTFTLPWPQGKQEINMDFEGIGMGGWTKEKSLAK